MILSDSLDVKALKQLVTGSFSYYLIRPESIIYGSLRCLEKQ